MTPASSSPHPALRLSDRDLLAQCEVHTYRASGPGGQKRNKVDSAVRIRHVPTGVTAIAEDSRSQLQNRPLALRRLREAIAVRVRSPINLADFRTPREILDVSAADGRIRVSERNPVYPVVAATVLDVVAACQGRLSEAARVLGVSTHHLMLFLEEHVHAWQAAGTIRRQFGLRPLRSR